MIIHYFDVLPFGQISLWGYQQICPTWFFYDECSIILSIPFWVRKIRAKYRIGPHNIDVLSIIVGSMLGDCHGEMRSGSTRFCFSQSGIHIDYLL